VSRGTRAATDRRVLLGNEGGWWPDRIRCRRSSWIKVRSKNRLGLAVYLHWNVHDVHDRHPLLLLLCTSVPRRIRHDQVMSTRRVRALMLFGYRVVLPWSPAPLYLPGNVHHVHDCYAVAISMSPLSR